MNLLHRTTRPALLAFTCVAALVLTACGDSSNSAGVGVQPSQAGSTSPVPAVSSQATSAGSAEPVPATDGPSTAPSASASTEPLATPDPVPAEVSSKPRLIAYAGGETPGIVVKTKDDVDDLHGAPTAFKTFIGRTVTQLRAKADCDDGYVGVTVETLRTDGFAVGGVNDCGGYQALWVVVDGKWKEVQGTQEIWNCAVLERYEVPTEVVNDVCYDYKAKKQRAYAHD